MKRSLSVCRNTPPRPISNGAPLRGRFPFLPPWILRYTLMAHIRNIISLFCISFYWDFSWHFTVTAAIMTKTLLPSTTLSSIPARLLVARHLRLRYLSPHKLRQDLRQRHRHQWVIYNFPLNYRKLFCLIFPNI